MLGCSSPIPQKLHTTNIAAMSLFLSSLAVGMRIHHQNRPLVASLLDEGPIEEVIEVKICFGDKKYMYPSS